MSNSRELSQLADLITIDDNTRNIGFSTLTNIGIGTSSPNHKLNVGGNANITGIISASTFVGSASGLTNVPAESIVGTLPQLDGSNLINLIGLGSGINIRSSDSILGIASVINFGNNIDVTFSSGVSTISINSIGYATSSGIATYASNAGIATYATSAGIATYATNAGIATYATNAGIATYATNAGIATYATNAGIATYATNAGIATYATNAGIATYATYATNAGIATSVIGGITSVTSLSVSGVSTVGVLTASSIGIGTTNPTSKLHVVGNTLVTGILTSSSFSGNGANLTGIVTSIVAGTNITISGSTGQVTVNSTANTNTTINDNTSSSSPLYLTAVSNTSGTVQSLSVSSTRLSFIPSTGTLSATTFSGALTGTASNVTTNANLTGDVTSTGNATSIAANVIVDADINTSAGIVDTKLATISTAGKVSNSATTATNADTPFAIVARDVSGNFSAGIITATSFSGSGANLTNLNATNLTSGKIPDGRFPDTLPAISGANLTNLNPSNLTSGTITATSFVKTGGTSSQFLKADGTVDNSLYIALTSNYTQNGASTPRSIQSKLNDIVSVKDFGAAGTGSADDTASIQNAVNYASSNGKCVYFPAGIYIINSTISTTLAGDKSISFLGDGVGVSIIKLNPASGNGIEINLPGEWWLSGAGGSNGFSMRGLTFETGISPSANSSGIKIIGDSYEGRPQRSIVISEIEFQAQTYMQYGFKKWLHIVRQGDIKISDCNFRLDNQNLGTGIHVDDGGAQINSFSTIQITNTDFIYGNKAIELNDFFEGLYVTNCGFVAANYGIFCNVDGAESGMNLINSHLNCNVCCVYLKGMVQSNISNNLIYANGGSDTIGIELLGSSGEYVITGNSIINLGSANYGIVIDGYNQTNPPHERSSLIAANYIKGFEQYGIWIKSTAKYLKVGDNHIWNCGQGLILKQSSDHISIFKQQFLESFVLNLNGSTEQTHDMAIPSSVFQVAPLLGIIQCNTDSRVLCRLSDGGTTSTNARIIITMIGGGNLPSGNHRFSVILSHLSGQ